VSRRNAISEDLRKLGLILIAAGIVAGFLRGQVSAGAAILAAISGLALSFVG
jgi:hypothetical protein